MGKKKNKETPVEALTAWPFPVGGPLDESQLKGEEVYMQTVTEVSYVHVRNDGGYSYTLAYRPAVCGRQSNFVDMAVAVCSPEDQFNRKLGRDLSTSRLLNGEYVTLPLGQFGKDRIASILHGMFSEDNHVDFALAKSLAKGVSV